MFNEKMGEKSWGYILPVVAVATGLVDNIRYARALQIKPDETRRYFKKTTDLSICYAGFAQDISLTQARGAGHAAFLSCAYDVVSDWGKPLALRASFERILYSQTSSELADMALGLLEHDVKGVLSDDGLERGVVALEFVLQMMRVREIFDRKCDIRQLGLNLQITDDVLDWEDDIVAGDQNCLTNIELRETYLRRLPDNFGDSTLNTLFPYGKLLTYAVRRVRHKAEDMLVRPNKYFSS